ncbi:uncharacterized protein TNCV_3361631 [Trichonephila clavipes]|nr:uncharacterized protein TNCV_3361631 [Trichonephila clavipes]
MPKEVEELVFVWASRLSPYPWVRFDYPFPFVIRSKNRGELQCLLKQKTVVVEQGQEIPQKAIETLCSTPLTKAPKIRKSKRKPNASVKTAEAANARKVAMERDYEQIAQFREEEHRATMTYKKKQHILKMKVLKATLGHYNLLNKKNEIRFRERK